MRGGRRIREGKVKIDVKGRRKEEEELWNEIIQKLFNVAEKIS